MQNMRMLRRPDMIRIMDGCVGAYTLVKKIGEGGFGTVYQAEHNYLGTKACIKINTKASESDADFLRYEAQLLWQLDEYHSIPSVKDFISLTPQRAALVMKLIEGETLEDLVARNGPIHPEDACWITERLLGALHYAHCNSVIHTDVKPQNVFVEPAKRDIKLIDFGLATYKPTDTTKPLGYSPRYAAPEIIAGNPPLPETDFYGVGMVMLRALGGDIAKKSFRADTPEEIVQFCQKLLRYDPRDRPRWEKGNPLSKLSDIRETVFGRRHLEISQVKGGGR